MRPAAPKPSSTATSTPSSAHKRKRQSVTNLLPPWLRAPALSTSAHPEVSKDRFPSPAKPEASKAKRFTAVSLALAVAVLTALLLPSSSFLLPLPTHAHSAPT